MLFYLMLVITVDLFCVTSIVYSPSHLARTPYIFTETHTLTSPLLKLFHSSAISVTLLPAISSLILHYLSIWGSNPVCVCWCLEHLGKGDVWASLKLFIPRSPPFIFYARYPIVQCSHLISNSAYGLCWSLRVRRRHFRHVALSGPVFFQPYGARPSSKAKEKPRAIEDWCRSASCLVKMDERGGTMMEAAKGLPYRLLWKEAGQLSSYCLLALRKYSICAQPYVRHISHKSS